MDKFIKRNFNNSPHEPETIFTSSVEKFKDKDSNLFKYAKRDKLINKDNPQKRKNIDFITVPVAENVSFEEASSMSLSFRVDNIKGKLMPVYVLENKADDTLSSVCTWQFIDGSEISEVVTYPKEKGASTGPNVLSLLVQMIPKGSNENIPAATTKCNHCGSIVRIDLSECPTCNRPI
jgi:hypothetical protein